MAENFQVFENKTKNSIFRKRFYFSLIGFSIYGNRIQLKQQWFFQSIWILEKIIKQ